MSVVSTSQSQGSNPTVSVTGTSQQLAVGTIYYASNPSTRVAFMLPTVGNAGDVLRVRGNAQGGWRITQTAGQAIHGSTDTTRGTSGYLESQTGDDCITLELMPGAGVTDFKVINPRGTLTYG